MIDLGVEASAHTFGIGIIKDKKILANVRSNYITEKGGIVPIEAARHHERTWEETLEKALKEAKIKIQDVDLISFSSGPGLGPCLKVGLDVSKKLAKKYKKPLVEVNHCCAHLEVGKFFTKAKDPVLLYVSGANTQVIAYEGKKYRIFGETLDQGVGNSLDAFARHMGLGFPGGPKLYELGKNGKYVELPYIVKGMDISVSGILTNLKQKYDKGFSKEDLAYSAQETIFSMLMEVAERAMAHCQKKELLLGGGVCCNKRLQEMSKIMCRERNAECFIPDNSLMVDNGVMIAVLGLLKYKAGGKVSVDKAKTNPYERTDDVDVIW